MASKKKDIVQRYSWFPEFVLGIILVASKFIFAKIHRSFPGGKNREVLIPEHPRVYFANHVAETDIPAVSNVHCLFKKPRIRFSIPIREDMIGRNFLVKEFKPKGLLKWILHFIDSTRIIPRLFRIVGALPVKRPFRDNSRELLKEGKLREQVEKDWKVLADRIESGLNVMMFPEGAYSEDGYLRSIKNGLAYLSAKRPDLSFYYFNFTYDYLSYKKPAIHIGFGEIFRIPEGMSREEIASMVKDRLGKIYTVTAANLTSFVILNSRVFIGKSKDWIVRYVGDLSGRIYDLGGIYVSKALREGKNQKQILGILDSMVRKKVIALSKTGDILMGVNWEKESSGDRAKKAKKERPFYYHRNQLRYFDQKIMDLIAEIA